MQKNKTKITQALETAILNKKRPNNSSEKNNENHTKPKFSGIRRNETKKQ